MGFIARRRRVEVWRLGCWLGCVDLVKGFGLVVRHVRKSPAALETGRVSFGDFSSEAHQIAKGNQTGCCALLSLTVPPVWLTILSHYSVHLKCPQSHAARGNVV